MRTLRTAILAVSMLISLQVENSFAEEIDINLRKFMETRGMQPSAIPSRKFKDQSLMTEREKDEEVTASAGIFMLYCEADDDVVKLMCRSFISGYSQAWLEQLTRRRKLDITKCASFLTYEALFVRMQATTKGSDWARLPTGIAISSAIYAALDDGGCLT